MTTHRQIATRECCVTKQILPKTELMRFVVGPDDQIYPDVTGKAGGRGVWVTPTAHHVAEAQKRKAFTRALKMQVKMPDDLAGLTQEHLENRLIGALQLARKGGFLVMGAVKVRSALESDKARALITAQDAREDGRRKMMQLLRVLELDDTLPHIDILGAEQLSLAFGGKNVIHAALVGGAAANSALERYKTLVRYLAKT
ncbi:RNA-binding protein [Maritalea sp.]|uniref:RNA-binding protein n=1 Tax=Maritalea sp. TaxID=2003361 RepID=UPI003EF55A26